MLVSKSLLDERQIVKSIEIYARKKLLKQYRVVEAAEYASIVRDRKAQARNLSNELRKDGFSLTSAQQTVFHTLKKIRKGYKFKPLEEIILFHCARILQYELVPKLQNSIFGFTRGRGVVPALRTVTDYIRTCKDAPLFCIRADIESFGESINQEVLCKSLEQLLCDDPLALSIYKKITTFTYLNEQQQSMPGQGLPTGTFWQLVAGQALLQGLDEALSNKEQQFYARYGDDILVITQDLQSAQESLNFINSWLQNKKLQLNYNKTRLIHFSATGPWRKISLQNVAAKDLRQLETKESSFGYLGFQIIRDGQLMLTSDLRHKVKLLIESRLKSVAFAHQIVGRASTVSTQERITMLSKALLHLIQEESPESSIVRLALYAPVSEEEIQSLDLWLKTKILTFALYRKPNKDLWKKYSFAQLRTLGVPSLLHGSRTRFREHKNV